MHILADKMQEFLPTRQTLLSRLRDVGDQDSWQEFFNLYWKLIYNTALKSGLTEAEAQDVVQETIISLSKKMPQFQYDSAHGSFKAWLLQLTRWRIIDQLRKRQRDIQKSLDWNGSTRTSTIDRIPDPAGATLDTYWNQEWHQNILEAAIERTKRRVDPKQYQVFDLCVLKEWPSTKVAAALKVNVAWVYTAKHRVSRWVKREVKALENRYM